MKFYHYDNGDVCQEVTFSLCNESLVFGAIKINTASLLS